MRACHPHSGLWPLLLDESAQPWAIGQVVPDDPRQIDHFTAEGFMAEVWEEWVAQMPPDALGELEPYGAICPGTAPPGVLKADPEAVADWYAGLLAAKGMPLGLVAAGRGRTRWRSWAGRARCTTTSGWCRWRPWCAAGRTGSGPAW
jgi:hypothetical protein